MANSKYMSPEIYEVSCYAVCGYHKTNKMCRDFSLHILHNEYNAIIGVIRRACKNLYIQYDLL